MSLREVVRRLMTERGVTAAVPDDEPEVRLAIYDSPLTTPRVVSLAGENFDAFVGELAAQTYNYAHERGGRIPFVVIREVVENLIHAYFRDAVVTILDDGDTIRISDQGPGIRDKPRALQPGFTTATREMRHYIRGVGSGLPVAREQLAFLGGTLAIEDNLDGGTVVTLSLAKPPTGPGAVAPGRLRRPELSARQKKVLLLIGELGSAGPTTIAKELDISHSTAYRELRALENLRLVQSKGSGKRTLTEDGIAFLGEIFAT